MARRRASSFGPKGISVSFYDPDLGRSRSITVYDARLDSVAQEAERALGSKWRTTSLTDRRHKRRL